MKGNIMNVYELAKLEKDYLINLRRKIHSNPELSWQEYKTCDLICEQLENMGVKYENVCGTGVIATIEGSRKNCVIGLRADMDALAITEAVDCEYKSKNDGVMHACGHDSHVAMLLGAAKILYGNRDKLNCTVKLIFQPAEEIIQGAKEIVNCDVINDINSIMAVHIWSDLAYGKISVESGPRMASVDNIFITVKGKSGHGSMPHQTIDAIVTASSIVMNLQTIASRTVNPLEPVVISIGTFNAGTASNIIANTAQLTGTVRCFNKELRKQLPDMIENIVSNVAKAYGANYDYEYKCCTGPTINDKKCSELALNSVKKILGEDAIVEMEKTMGGEDFSYYLEKIPGCIAFVGCRNEETSKFWPHHHEKFDIEENAMINGTALMVQYVLETQNEL